MKCPEPGTPEYLLHCVEQEMILLTKISDITKQVEVRSRQKDIDVGNLPNQRQIYIDRLKKCRQMIDASCRALPEGQRERYESILSGRFSEETSAPDEAKLLAYSERCCSLLQKTLEMDVEARVRMQKECERLQHLMQNARKSSRKATPKNYS